MLRFFTVSRLPSSPKGFRLRLKATPRQDAETRAMNAYIYFEIGYSLSAYEK
jgi:hypothetical protein